MLVRLKVTGFKNLVDVDVRFGPFTCIAGANAVGKSNLFDAITFLAALADDEFAVAARKVREGTTADIRNLFHRHGGAHEPRMRLEAEMIIPQDGVDELGRDVKAAITFVRYIIELSYEDPATKHAPGRIALSREELRQINVGVCWFTVNWNSRRLAQVKSEPPVTDFAASCREGLTHACQSRSGVDLERDRESPPDPGSGLGPRVGARGTPQQSPILRPGQPRFSPVPSAHATSRAARRFRRRASRAASSLRSRSAKITGSSPASLSSGATYPNALCKRVEL